MEYESAPSQLIFTKKYLIINRVLKLLMRINKYKIITFLKCNCKIQLAQQLLHGISKPNLYERAHQSIILDSLD